MIDQQTNPNNSLANLSPEEIEKRASKFRRFMAAGAVVLAAALAAPTVSENFSELKEQATTEVEPSYIPQRGDELTPITIVSGLYVSEIGRIIDDEGDARAVTDQINHKLHQLMDEDGREKDDTGYIVVYATTPKLENRFVDVVRTREEVEQMMVELDETNN